jgi:hypothetical protein
MNAVVQTPGYEVARDGVTSLVGPAIDAQSPAAEFQHFGHENQAIERSTFV